MKKPIFLEDLHEYDVEIDKDVYTIYYSEGEQWSSSSQGKMIIQIKDTGNEFKITHGTPVVRNKIEYDVMLELSILMKVIFQDRTIEIAEKTKI
jgi:hypothetical protein